MSEPTPMPSLPSPPGLPPVQPPSGQMILRLFLVPLLIVAVLVGIYLLGHALYGKAGRSRSAETYLRNLDNSNPDIRWRAASDLSQELPRSPQLAGDSRFALDLAERLKLAIDESAASEKEFAARYDDLSESEKEGRLSRELLPGRKLVMFLSASLGNFQVPVGVPLLEQLALQTSGLEPEALSERRGGALLALAALGKNLQRYDQLSDAEKDHIDEELAQADRTGQERWAKSTRDYLQRRRAGKADTFGVANVLQQCAEEEDPFLRELSALASNFWKGTAKEDASVEGFLVRLTRDDGRGEEMLAQRLARNPDNRQSQAVTRRKGFQVQANANLALARRGSPRVRLDLLEEMLDPQLLSEVFVLRQAKKDGGSPREEPNAGLVAVTVVASLDAVGELHDQRPEMKLDGVRAKVMALTQHENRAIQAEADKIRQRLAAR